MEKLFQYQNKSVRTTEEDGQVWFVAKDVVEALGLTWKGDAANLSNIKDEWKGAWEFQTPGGKQFLLCITEPAVYKLAFRSNKPEAEKFTDWVAGEVVPQIRSTGKYVTSSAGVLPLQSHTKKDVQVQMSKNVNGHQYYRGGKLACIKYNVKNCLTHTGKVPTAIKEEGKKLKLPSRVTRSAKEVIRHLQPEKACAMSMADNLVEQGHNEDKVFPVTKKAESVFKDLLKLGIMPAELQA